MVEMQRTEDTVMAYFKVVYRHSFGNPNIKKIDKPQK
jgi:hypothetical protein